MTKKKELPEVVISGKSKMEFIKELWDWAIFYEKTIASQDVRKFPQLREVNGKILGGMKLLDVLGWEADFDMIGKSHGTYFTHLNLRRENSLRKKLGKCAFQDWLIALKVYDNVYRELSEREVPYEQFIDRIKDIKTFFEPVPQPTFEDLRSIENGTGFMGAAMEDLSSIMEEPEREEEIMTKVVKSIIVRRKLGDDVYTVNDSIYITVGETRILGVISHIDEMTRTVDNQTHTYYDVYAKLPEGEKAFHVVTLSDIPVEVKYGYRPF